MKTTREEKALITALFRWRTAGMAMTVDRLPYTASFDFMHRWFSIRGRNCTPRAFWLAVLDCRKTSEFGPLMAKSPTREKRLKVGEATDGAVLAKRAVEKYEAALRAELNDPVTDATEQAEHAAERYEGDGRVTQPEGSVE